MSFAGCDPAFSDLEYTLFSQFLPVLFGCEITLSERKLDWVVWVF